MWLDSKFAIAREDARKRAGTRARNDFFNGLLWPY
jgi:hypothetical protein